MPNMHTGAHSGHKRAPDILELALKADVGLLAWVLVTEPMFSSKTANAVKGSVISLSPVLLVNLKEKFLKEDNKT